MLKKKVSTEASVAVLLTALLIVVFGIIIPRLHMMNEVMFGYYHTLPVSETAADFDRDGIPNWIDDSDGDTISDKWDATPFGNLRAAAPEEEVAEDEASIADDASN